MAQQTAIGWKQAVKANYTQIFFIFAAFFLMVTVSYFSVGDIVRQQSIRMLNDAMMTAEANIMASLSKSEIVLDLEAGNIQEMLDKKAPHTEIQRYLSNSTAWMRRNNSWGIRPQGIYGYLHGEFLSALSPSSSAVSGYRVQASPWYDTASRNPGLEISYTQPYRDDKPGGSGKFIMSSVRNVFGQNGQYHGILAMDLDMVWFQDGARTFQVPDNGYLIILNKYMEVVAHPQDDFVGRPFRDLGNGYRQLAWRLIERRELAIQRAVDTDGSDIVASFKQMPNGWFIGIVVPHDSYTSATGDTAIILSFLGFVLMSVLIYTHLRTSLARMRSEEANRNKSNVLARMSHEIRTPMNVVIGMSELAHREYGTARGLEYLVGIKVAGVALLDIINDILDFSKIESGQLKLNEAPYEIASLLNDILTIISIRAREKPLELTMSTNPNIPCQMVGDAGRIRQILLNLLSNAVKYTDRGFVKLFISGEAVEREGEERAIRLRMTVSDSGRGISPEDMPKLFRDFTRIDEKRNMAIEGTGLGLVITRNLCLAMGGNITAESEYGLGSIFTATIIQNVSDWTPIGRMPSLQPSHLESQQASFIAPRASVLLVDDFPSNLLVAEGLIAPYKIQVFTCLNGREALKEIKERRFDLIFMDHMMPEMDGMEATAAIRAMGGDFAAIPIVALTANVVAGMREEFLAGGFNDILPKPIELRKLDAVLKKWIPAEKQEKKADDDQEESESGPPEITGVNSLAAMARLGNSRPLYLNLLAAFRRDALESLPHFDKMPEGDLKPFITRVHGLKSGLANVGADFLSQIAALLEEAGQMGDRPQIRENLPIFRGELRDLITRITTFIETSKGPEPASGETGLPEALTALRAALDAKDIDAIDRELARLSALPLPRAWQDAVSELADLILMADLSGAAAIVNSMINEGVDGKP